MSAGRASLPAVFLGAVSTILVVLGVWAWQDYRSNAPLPAQAVLSRPQMAAVAEGVKSYEAANGRRPARLEELLAGGHVKPADLFDSRRKVDRAIDPETGRFLATPHRVIMPKRDRYSMAMFFNPNHDTMAVPLPTCVTPERPVAFEPVSMLDYMSWYMDTNYRLEGGGRQQ